MTTKPNILLITADQWRGDCLGCVGHPDVKTPNLDALAEQAALFRNHYSGAAPCGPARACLYTGLQSFRSRAIQNGTPMAASIDNIARMGQRAGYAPTLFGFTDIAVDPRGLEPDDPRLFTYEGVLPGFEVGQALKGDQLPWKDWLRSLGYPDDVVDDPYKVPQSPSQRISLEPTSFAAEHSQTAFLTEKFVDWMTASDPSTPWFAHISYIHPHPPFGAPVPFNTMYDPASPLPFAGQDADPLGNDHPLVELLRDRHSASDFVPKAEGALADLTDEDLRRVRALYYGLISEVDAQIGRLIAALKDAGVWDNTVLIFTSDHAEMMGDHGLLGKGGFYPQSQHIPLIIKPQGTARAQDITVLTSAVDIYATLAEIMDVGMGHVPNGSSLVPAFQGQSDVENRHSILWEFDFRELVDDDWLKARDLTPNDANMIARLSPSELFVYSEAFEPLAFDVSSDRTCLTNQIERDPTLRGRLFEALCRDLAGLRDNTLTNTHIGRKGVVQLSEQPKTYPVIAPGT